VLKIIAAVVGSMLATVGVLYFAGAINMGGAASADDAGGAGADGEAEVPEVAPSYLALEPPFVVNFTHRGTLRYLQVSLELAYQDPALLAKVTERMPQVRNDLILLFSNQDYEKLSTKIGKEELRQEILSAINHVIGIAKPLPAEMPPGSVPVADEQGVAQEQSPWPGEVYITNFVMQ
jgi:flagellar FliL protein